MKTIIAATDFSPASRNAASYAVELARTVGDKVILYTAYHVPHPPPGLFTSTSRYSCMMEADRQLLAMANEIDPGREVVEVACDEGKAADCIIAIANEKKANYIVAGMKGAGNSFVNFFGSTSVSLAIKSNIPVIIVPDDKTFKLPATILIATDDLSDQITMDNDMITEHTAQGSSKIMAIKTPEHFFDAAFDTTHFNKLITDALQDPTLPAEFCADDAIRSLLKKSIGDNSADMLVMSPYNGGWLDKILDSSFARDIIFHCAIPIMIFPAGDHKAAVHKQATMAHLDE